MSLNRNSNSAQHSALLATRQVCHDRVPGSHCPGLSCERSSAVACTRRRPCALVFVRLAMSCAAKFPVTTHRVRLCRKTTFLCRNIASPYPGPPYCDIKTSIKTREKTLSQHNSTWPRPKTITTEGHCRDTRPKTNSVTTEKASIATQVSQHAWEPCVTRRTWLRHRARKLCTTHASAGCAPKVCCCAPTPTLLSVLCGSITLVRIACVRLPSRPR